MTMLKHTWYPGRPAIRLDVALEASLTSTDRDGIAERALEVTEQNAKAIASLVALLADKRLLTLTEALDVCDAGYKYEAVDAPADGS